MAAPKPLSPDALCWRCEPGNFTFETTGELEDLGEVIGQDRAVEAIHFAVGMAKPGYNFYALGPEGTGKHTVVRRFLEDSAKDRPPPSDWCYISNFKERRQPRALRLAAGRGAAFRDHMARFVEEVKDALTSAFESDEYRNRRQVVEEEFKERQEKAVEEIETDGQAHDIALLRTPVGFAFAPITEGKVVSPEVFQRFPKAERERIEGQIEDLQKRLQAALQQVPLWMKEMRDRLRALNNETALFAVSHLVADLRKAYGDLPEVLDHLQDVQDDVVENVALIVGGPQKPSADGASVESEDGHPLFRRYRVNLIVDNSAIDHAPVVYEDDPTYDRLLGRVEHRAEMGTLLTDFHLVRGGALHRANGGYHGLGGLEAGALRRRDQDRVRGPGHGHLEHRDLGAGTDLDRPQGGDYRRAQALLSLVPTRSRVQPLVQGGRRFRRADRAQRRQQYGLRPPGGHGRAERGSAPLRSGGRGQGLGIQRPPGR
jgi:predicted ATP-dependent protease